MRYSANATAIGPAGRKVRCASCGHNWVVDGEGEEQGTSVTPPKEVVEPTQEPVVAETAPEPEVEPQRPRDPQVAQAMRARREAERQKQKRLRATGVWGGIVASFLLVLASAWVFRIDVVRIWPNTASVFAMLGSPGNLYGLEVHEIAAVRRTRDGASVLQISGQIVNVSASEQRVPLLQAELLDDKDQAVFSWRIEPDQTRLQTEQSFGFVTEVRDPPPGALRVVIVFADEHPEPKPGSSDPVEHKSKPETPPAEEHASGH